MFGFLKSGSKSESESNAVKSADIDILHDIRQKLEQNDDPADISDSDFEDHFHEFAYSDEDENIEVLESKSDDMHESELSSIDSNSVEPSISSSHTYSDDYSYSSDKEDNLLNVVNFDVEDVSNKLNVVSKEEYGDIITDSSSNSHAESDDVSYYDNEPEDSHEPQEAQEESEDDVKYKNPFTNENLDSYNDADFSYPDYEEYRAKLNDSTSRQQANEDLDRLSHKEEAALKRHNEYGSDDLRNISMTSNDLDGIESEMSMDDDDDLDDDLYHDDDDIYEGEDLKEGHNSMSHEEDESKEESQEHELHASSSETEDSQNEDSYNEDLDDDEFKDDIVAIDDEEDAIMDDDDEYDVSHNHEDNAKESIHNHQASSNDYAIDAGGYEDEDDLSYGLSGEEFADNSAISSQLSQKTSEALGKLVTKLVTTKVSSWLDRWLNENLPDLVHNIVEEKISAMISDEELEKLDAQNHHMGLHSHKESSENSQS